MIIGFLHLGSFRLIITFFLCCSPHFLGFFLIGFQNRFKVGILRTVFRYFGLVFRPVIAFTLGAWSACTHKKKGKKDAPGPAGNEFQQLVTETLPGKWDVQAPTGDSKVTMASEKGEMLRFPVSRALMSVTVDAASKAEWDLSFSEASNKVLEIIASHAENQGVAHTGELGCVDKAQKPITVDVSAIHERMHGTAP